MQCELMKILKKIQFQSRPFCVKSQADKVSAVCDRSIGNLFELGDWDDFQLTYGLFVCK